MERGPVLNQECRQECRTMVSSCITTPTLLPENLIFDCVANFLIINHGSALLVNTRSLHPLLPSPPSLPAIHSSLLPFDRASRQRSITSVGEGEMLHKVMEILSPSSIKS